MPAPQRIIVPVDSQNKDSWELAIAYAEKICQGESPSVESVVLLIHTKAQLNHTSLAGFIGKDGVKLLNSGGQLRFASGASLRLATKQTIGSLPKRSVVIVFYAEDKLLEVVDGLHNLAGVVAVPDLPDDGAQWIARWNPIMHGKPAQAPSKLIVDPVVENALKAVTGRINLGNGVLNPRDKEYAQEVLRILRAKGHKAEPSAVKSWAIQNGWKNGAATELAKLSDRILSMATKPKLAAIYNAEGKYESWTK